MVEEKTTNPPEDPDISVNENIKRKGEVDVLSRNVGSRPLPPPRILNPYDAKPPRMWHGVGGPGLPPGGFIPPGPMFAHPSQAHSHMHHTGVHLPPPLAFRPMLGGHGGLGAPRPPLMRGPPPPPPLGPRPPRNGMPGMGIGSHHPPFFHMPFGSSQGPGGPIPPSFEVGVMGKPPTRGNAQVELRNDYCQHFVDTGHRPQNFIRDSSVEDRFKLYPKVQRLIDLKDHLVAHRATPPMYMNVDLKTFNLRDMGTKFDVILVDPPWEEYSRRSTHHHLPFWKFEEIEQLNIEDIADSPSYLFLWCGSGGRLSEKTYHLDEGRRLLRKWGFRRCEDICWLKTNHKKQKNTHSDLGVLAHTKEHCLMGIRGTVRRSTDVHFIHANVDTDIIVSEEPKDPSSTDKPDEIYKIIEHFCLGRRRLELFGRIHNIRRGWVTLGNELSNSNFNVEAYLKEMTVKGDAADGSKCAGHLVGSLHEIEELRPRSPGMKPLPPKISPPPLEVLAAAPKVLLPPQENESKGGEVKSDLNSTSDTANAETKVEDQVAVDSK